MTVLNAVAAAALVLGTQAAIAQTVPTAGATVIVPAYGEVTAPNDQAVAVLAIEEQDKDKTAAASRVNQKIKQGLEILKKEDPQAKLKTQGYYTYPVYPEDRPLPPGAAAKPRLPTSWRVGQFVQMTTTNIEALPKTVASAQKVLTLNGLSFGLSPAATRKLDDARIAATYKNLNERIASIASAMGRPLTDAVLDTIDYEGSGNYAGGPAGAAPAMMRMSAKAEMDQSVAEPSFEPGETTLEMRVVGKVKFK
ncbi:SIMPL domain-containing protein [Pseudoduganella violaceinigra]|uniref:SIMPL domain-containing protein n=1 Tax=Pseudoduganella violaceinigra TaxID=246602 RepID=UPI0003FD324D|nr:SIMPL domain-containing protein [Pseudoduganella violaceinigra]